VTDEPQDRSTDTSDNANQAETTTDPITKVPPAEHPLVIKYREEIDRCGPKPTVTVTGLFANSDDDEKKRVYLSPQFDYYADFLVSDVLYYETVPPDYSPISGYAVTRFTLKRGSQITFTYVRTQSLIADDQFDIDIRVEGAPGSIPPGAHGVLDDRTMNPTATCHAC
jgi:hypothetical protein